LQCSEAALAGDAPTVSPPTIMAVVTATFPLMFNILASLLA
jgi:hypothetical protein